MSKKTVNISLLNDRVTATVSADIAAGKIGFASTARKFEKDVYASME